jgi:vitamin B12 transporter
MKKCISNARLTVLSLAVSAAFPLFAQTIDTVKLAETVVTATRNTQLLSATLAHTTLITREEIERSQAIDLVTLLEREAGLQRTQNGGVGSTSTIFMRGAPALQTLVLIDGVPQNKQDASGAVSLEHIMLDNVERIEIVRGNVSAIYGSGAIGGVIQIFTRTGSSKPSATVSLEFGPRASRKAVANASVSAGETAISAGVSRTTTDGFSAVNVSQFPTANPDQDGYQNTSANLSLTHKLSQNHQFGLRMAQSQGDASYDNYFGAATDQQSSTTKMSQATIFSTNQWGNWNSRVSLSQQSDKSVTRDDGAFGSIDGFTTQATVLTWVNTLALGGDWLATGGAEQQRQHVDTNSSSPFNAIYDQNRTSNSLFAGIEGKVAGGSVQFNLRNDKVGELEQTTGYLGYGYPLTEQLKAIASASTAFNAPPLGYLFAPGWGNPLLKPELAQSREVGLQYAQGKHLLRATIFDTRVEDELTYDKTISKFSNIARTKNNGVELSYRGSVGATEWRASLTDQNPVDDITGELLTRRAKTMASVGVSQALGAWHAGANLRYSGERNDIYSDPATFATVKNKLAAYSVLDLAVSYRWSPEVLLTARLENATDESYQTVFGYNQQPRSVYAGLTWTPKR